MKITANELRTKYLRFFKSKDHAIIPSASLIPENDPTVLFTTAGMQPLVPFFLGQPHPLGKRITDVQKCIRTGDIDDVGDTYHHTFFEMLGNWSLGDYFKKEAIEFTFEFLTKVLQIPLEKLGVTVFGGDKRFPNIPKDDEAAEIWLKLGIPKERVAYMPSGIIEMKDNWWGPAGQTGPCGPSTEVFFWRGKEKTPKNFNPEDSTWVEIGNDVLLCYTKDKQGNYNLSKQRNIDFGGGLERTLAVLNGFDDNYKTELFLPIIEAIEKLSGKKYESHKREMRIIADHLRAATFIMGDNKKITPSNVEQGYIVRRLIRRAIRVGRQLGIQENFCKLIAEIVITNYKEFFAELESNRKHVIDEIGSEEERFKEKLEQGIRHFNKIVENLGEEKVISSKDAFLLFQSYGFPIEITKELAKENKLKVDENGFYKEFELHQQKSREGAEQKFKSGLADSSVESTKLHTATHLLHAALREVLGGNVQQKGSNITPERLRFDFNYGSKMTPEQIKRVEDLVNTAISRGIDVSCQEVSPEEAKKEGAIGLFGEKYGDKVSVYTIGKVSKEICTGPHVKNTKEIGRFKIKKEESVAAGVRRIKAVVE